MLTFMSQGLRYAKIAIFVSQYIDYRSLAASNELFSVIFKVILEGN